MLSRPLRIFVLLLVTLTVPTGYAVADFYAGKTVKLVIPTSMGGEYGLYGQLVAQHMGRHLEGKPTIVVESMPGAGGRRALNYMGNVAAKDGTVLIVPQSNIVLDGLLSLGVQYNPATFEWVGRLKEQTMVGVVWAKRTNAKTIGDAKIKELVAGGVGVSTAPTLVPRILNLIADTKFKVVTAYPGTNEVQIAWERGEVDVLTTPWDTLLRRFEPQIRSGEVVPLYVYGSRHPAGLEHLPLVHTELGRTSGEKAFLDLYASAANIGRSVAAPPGVPASQLTMLRTAFERMLADTAFKAAVATGNINLDPLSGNDLSVAVRATLKQSEQHVADARTIYDRLLAQK